MNSEQIEEFASTIKNSLEQGESIEKVKQSFINAGYNPQEVEKASAQNSTSMIIKPAETTSKKSEPILKPVKLKPLPEKTEESKVEYEKPQKSNFGIIILIVASVLILIGSALLGLYWDRIF